MTDPIQERSPDQLAAEQLLWELQTRIATQALPYQYGVDATALKSLWEIFGLTRKAIKDHPGCEAFARTATKMLNAELRPITAKWHRAHQSGVLASRDGSNEFRADLVKLQGKLSAFCIELQKMAYGRAVADEAAPEVLSPADLEQCFRPVQFGLDANALGSDGINRDEAKEIKTRRTTFGIATVCGHDAIGLALSGGGIRSATFCLGAVQVLAQRDLLKDVDYLSTVSGGGYTGSFITSWVGTAQSFAQVGNPNGPDTKAVSHLRRNAKYLSAIDWKERWGMVTSTIAGLLLNWTGLFAGLAALAALFGTIEPVGDPEPWLLLASAGAGLSALSMLAFGIALRRQKCVNCAGIVLGVTAGVSAALLVGAGVERLYGWFHRWQSNHWVLPVAAAVPIVAPAAVRFLPLFKTPNRRQLALRFALILAGAIVPIEGLLVYFQLRILASQSVTMDIVVAGAAAAAGAFAFFGLDINQTGPHRLYRDKLARTFIEHVSGDQAPQLDQLNPKGHAPYHLINAIINLPSSTRDDLRDRRGDFFLFSKHWSGSSIVGYAPTDKWKAAGKTIDLATAMAISGAAASPHMGLQSVPGLSALMAFLNIRLGFWITNPKRCTSGHPDIRCLVKEMFGFKMSEDQAWLNLSDGGHIENMGIYELLRRRCKFIVCVDGEADPASTFQGQLTLVRHAQIDLGVWMEPRFDDLRPDPLSRFSKSHLQLFRVHYPPRNGGSKEIGLMLYMKLSLTGNEAELLKRYQALHPEFPHQSTLDQFYDEEQFEAYRQLGVHVAEGAFAPALISGTDNPGSVAEWFKRLAANMLEPTTEPY